MKILALALAAILVTSSAAFAQTRPLGDPQIKANGDLMLGPTFKLGRQETDGRVILQPYALQLLGPGTTGDVSATSVKAPGSPDGQPLSKWFSTPSFVAASSPTMFNAYENDAQLEGEAAFAVMSSDGTSQASLATQDYRERYAGYFRYDGPGTGVPDVIGSSFALGASNIKRNWFGTTVPGQTIGMQIITRGGYHGADANSTVPEKPEFGGYNPAGDITAQIINTVQSSPYGQNAAGEYAIHYAKNGQFDANGDVHTMNIQLGAMRMLTPQGTSANPGIGIALSAARGTLGYAIQANNTARAGSYSIRPGIWNGFLRYNFDDGGTRAPFDAFRVDQDGSIHMSSGGATTPNKKLRVGSSGEWQVLNNAGTPILALSDTGVLTVGAGAAARQVQTVPGVWTAYSGNIVFEGGSTAAGTFNGRYEVVGKKLTLTATYAVSSAGGTPGNSLRLPLPAGLTVGVACPGSGNEYAVVGKMLNVRSFGGDTSLQVINFDNTSPVATGAQGMLTVVCELQ